MEVVSDFFCKKCREDFESRATSVFLNRVIPKALVTNCPTCTTLCYRAQENRHKDPFYLRSKKLRKERRKHYIDTLQKSDSMFDIYHPQQRKERIEEENKKEYEQWLQKRK